MKNRFSRFFIFFGIVFGGIPLTAFIALVASGRQWMQSVSTAKKPGCWKRTARSSRMICGRVVGPHLRRVFLYRAESFYFRFITYG